MGIVEYESGSTFPGVIGRTAAESSPAWPAPARAAAGTPNVLTVVLDDTGHGQLGCYGSPIATPNFDALDGKLVGNTEAPTSTPFVLNPGGLTCGANPGSPVTPQYTSPFKFTGTIHKVTVDVSGELTADLEAELRAHMARQ